MADDARGTMRAYENGEIRVIWRPDLCAHSGCAWGLAEVFRPGAAMDRSRGAPSDRIVTQVEQCPSGALSWERV